MKEEPLPQIHLVRDTDLGVFAYELHIVERRIVIGTNSELI